jgi:DNA-binding transcriptional LysR family regulator
VVEAILAGNAQPVFLEKRHETDMSEALKMMALGGHGIAFLPDSTVGPELRARRLACAGPDWSARLEVRFYRERPAPGRASRRAVDELWRALEEEGRGSNRRPANRTSAG